MILFRRLNVDNSNLEQVKRHEQEFDKFVISSKSKNNNDSDDSIDFDAISTTSNLGRIMQRRKSLQQLAKEAVEVENSINNERRKSFSKFLKIDILFIFVKSLISVLIFSYVLRGNNW